MSKEQNIQSLMNMGYPRNRAEEAIRINGYVDSALDWLMKHPVGYDQPHSLKDDAPQGHTLGEDPIIGQSINGWGSSGQSLGGIGGSQPKKETQVEPPKRYMTQEEKEEQVKLLQEKIAKRKIEAADQSVMSDAESEALRREQGKASQEVKEEWENRQRDIAILEAKRDKERTARALEIAREQIAIDKLNREREYNKKMGIVTEEPATPVVIVEKKEYVECVLQIRMPPPLAKLTGNFKATDTMRDVVAFVQQNQLDKFDFQLMTPFPKKIYKGAELDTTLTAAQLCPRGAVVVEKI
jgi:hypothetical protein